MRDCFIKIIAAMTLVMIPAAWGSAQVITLWPPAELGPVDPFEYADNSELDQYYNFAYLDLSRDGIRTEQNHSPMGSKSLRLNRWGQLSGRFPLVEEGPGTSVTISVAYYDADLETPDNRTGITLGAFRQFDNEPVYWPYFTLGVLSTVSPTNYSRKNRFADPAYSVPTSARRTLGWHVFQISAENGTVEYRIDGEVVHTGTYAIQGFGLSGFSFGWVEGLENPVTYYDDVSVVAVTGKSGVDDWQLY